jgi:hypothetical protein
VIASVIAVAILIPGAAINLASSPIAPPIPEPSCLANVLAILYSLVSGSCRSSPPLSLTCVVFTDVSTTSSGSGSFSLPITSVYL